MRKILFCAAMALAVAAQAQETARQLLVHGHRGSRGTRPEDTLPAFNEALRAGADVLEMDMGVTRDGVIVISHDPNISPVICLGPGGKKLDKPVPIRTLTLEEVKKYDCGSIKNPKFPEQVPAPGTRIPTLDEMFAMVEASTYAAAAKVQFNIETKIFLAEPRLAPPPAEFVKLMADVVRKHGMAGRVILQSFDVRTLKEMKKLAPEIRTAQLTSEELLDVVPALKAAKTDIWSPNHKWITPEAVKEAQAAGIQVAPWTLNDPEEWETAIAAGVDAIITDYPEKLIAFLKEKKLR